jgi:hypothetical protein
VEVRTVASGRGRPKVEKPQRPPATTIEGRENQLVSLAIDLAEKQLSDGSASSQVITHFLKLGTTLFLLEKARLENENRLLEAKVENLAQAGRVEELYQKALAAMRSYAGNPDPPDGSD